MHLDDAGYDKIDVTSVLSHMHIFAINLYSVMSEANIYFESHKTL